MNGGHGLGEYFGRSCSARAESAIAAAFARTVTVLARASSGTAYRGLATDLQLPRHGCLESAKPRALLDLKWRPQSAARNLRCQGYRRWAEGGL
jgi:hypothetical protein